MKKAITYIVFACLLLTMLPFGAFAAEVETTEAEAVYREPGQCGEDLTWSYNSGTLTVSGTGAMDDYTDGDAPWLEYRDSITKVVFSGGVTSVGACAFLDYDNLTSVDFGSAMHTIGYRAFKSCDGLTEIWLPASFRRFGEESFMSCRNLTEIRCAGGMPSFNANCVWDTYANIYYPSNNPWPAEPVMQLFQAFQGRIQFYMAGESEVTPAQTTPPATEPAQTQPSVTEPEETVPETTEAETNPTTEPTETTEAVTEETTVETTEETAPETEEAEEEKKSGGFNGIWVGLFLITGCLSLVLIGALIFRRKSY